VNSYTVYMSLVDKTRHFSIGIPYQSETPFKRVWRGYVDGYQPTGQTLTQAQKVDQSWRSVSCGRFYLWVSMPLASTGQVTFTNAEITIWLSGGEDFIAVGKSNANFANIRAPTTARTEPEEHFESEHFLNHMSTEGPVEEAEGGAIPHVGHHFEMMGSTKSPIDNKATVAGVSYHNHSIQHDCKRFETVYNGSPNIVSFGTGVSGAHLVFPACPGRSMTTNEVAAVAAPTVPAGEAIRGALHYWSQFYIGWTGGLRVAIQGNIRNDMSQGHCSPRFKIVYVPANVPNLHGWGLDYISGWSSSPCQQTNDSGRQPQAWLTLSESSEIYIDLPCDTEFSWMYNSSFIKKTNQGTHAYGVGGAVVGHNGQAPTASNAQWAIFPDCDSTEWSAGTWWLATDPSSVATGDLPPMNFNIMVAGGDAFRFVGFFSIPKFTWQNNATGIASPTGVSRSFPMLNESKPSTKARNTPPRVRVVAGRILQ